MSRKTRNPTSSEKSLANNNSKVKKLLKTAVQILVTVIALSLVLQKTDIGEIGRIIQGANIWYLLASLLFFNISKVFNAVRLSRFFKAVGLELSWVYNLKLYYLGMFYNLFLPGGIGGDGYKIFVLKKNHEIKTINVFHAVFWDRICGIFALVFLSLILLIPSSFAVALPSTLPYALGRHHSHLPCSLSSEQVCIPAVSADIRNHCMGIDSGSGHTGYFRLVHSSGHLPLECRS